MCTLCFRYLFIRGLHDRDEVLAARLTVLQYISNSGDGKFDEAKPLAQGQLDVRCGHGCIPFMEVINVFKIFIRSLRNSCLWKVGYDYTVIFIL